MSFSKRIITRINIIYIEENGCHELCPINVKY